jgi:TRAP-type C4-dicarboxylate transport system permease small subunit
MKTLKFVWKYFEEIMAVILFILLMLDVVVQIASRLFFKNPLMFTEELGRFLYIWTFFAGTGWVYKKRRHIALDLFIKNFNEKGRYVFDIIVNVTTIGIFVVLIRWGIDFVIFQKVNLAPAMRFSMSYVYMIGPFCMAVGIIRIIQVIVEDCRTIAGFSAPERKEVL